MVPGALRGFISIEGLFSICLVSVSHLVSSLSLEQTRGVFNKQTHSLHFKIFPNLSNEHSLAVELIVDDTFWRCGGLGVDL